MAAKHNGGSVPFLIDYTETSISSRESGWRTPGGQAFFSPAFGRSWRIAFLAEIVNLIADRAPAIPSRTFSPDNDHLVAAVGGYCGVFASAR